MNQSTMSTGPISPADLMQDDPPPYSAGRARLSNEPGWIGLFSRHQAEGAIPNGTRVVKIKSDLGDAHPVGATATVLGSLPAYEGKFAYFLEWDDVPRHAVGTGGHKIAPIQQTAAV